MATQSQQIITIEKMVAGGIGLGRLANGMVILVRHVLPGEQVRVRTTRQKKSYMEAQLLEVLSASSDRTTPRCHLYGRCGGCDLQHAAAAAQLQIKADVFRESLRRSGWPEHFRALEHLAPVIPSSNPYGYRLRLRLHVDADGHLGFHRFQSHEVEPVINCPLAREELNICLKELHAAPAMPRLLHHCQDIELHLDPDRARVFVLLHFTRKPRPADYQLIKTLLTETTVIENVLLTVAGHGVFDADGARLDGREPPLLQCTIPAAITGSRELRLYWEAGGFYQVNQEQNEKMIRLVLDLAASGPHGRILDLYCGMGNFSLPLALLGDTVLGLEGQGAAIRSAARNAAANLQATGAGNGHPHCRFLKTPVLAGVQQLAADGETFDLVVLDPPRQGAAPIIPHLAALQARRVIYISCDPATLVRDLAGLAATGYTIDALRPLDMFPQTHHLETITLLQKDR